MGSYIMKTLPLICLFSLMTVPTVSRAYDDVAAVATIVTTARTSARFSDSNFYFICSNSPEFIESTISDGEQKWVQWYLIGESAHQFFALPITRFKNEVVLQPADIVGAFEKPPFSEFPYNSVVVPKETSLKNFEVNKTEKRFFAGYDASSGILLGKTTRHASIDINTTNGTGIIQEKRCQPMEPCYGVGLRNLVNCQMIDPRLQ